MGSERPQFEFPEPVTGPPTPLPPAPRSSAVSVSIEGRLADRHDVLGELSQKPENESLAVVLPGIRRARDRVRGSTKRCFTELGSAPNVVANLPYEGGESSATSTPLPIPDSERERGKGNGNGGGGNGNDGDGGPPKKKKGSGEHPLVNAEKMLVPTPLVLEVKKLLEKNHNITVETPELSPTSKNQREYREKLYGPTMVEKIYELQQLPGLKKIEELGLGIVTEDLLNEIVGKKKSEVASKIQELEEIIVSKLQDNITTKIFPENDLRKIIKSAFDKIFVDTVVTQNHLEKVFKAMQVGLYYFFLAEEDAYKAGEIPVANIAIMHGYSGVVDHAKLFCSIDGPTFERKKSIELAPGNGEISRDLREVRNRYFISAFMRYLLKKDKARVTNGRYDLAEAEATKEAEKLPKIDPFITSVDLAPKFVEKARKRGINSIQADICKPPLELFETTGIAPNSADFIYMHLAFDRLEDLHATLKIIKLLAKKDGSTKFQFGFYAPFSPETISFSKNENIPEFDCFDPSESLRNRWIGKNGEELSPTETIYRIIRDLNLPYGFKTKCLAEHEYEVYSVHCISEKAKTLREDPKYQFLKTYDFKDDELNDQRDAVFNGTVPDDQLVGFPERQNIVLIAGDITLPEDGRPYEKIQVLSGKKGRQKSVMVDPKHPKFAFLRDYDFGERKWNRRRDRLFISKSSGLFPYYEDMAAAREQYLKQSA